MKLSRRGLFKALGGLALGAAVGKEALGEDHRDYWRQRYAEGSITRETYNEQMISGYAQCGRPGSAITFLPPMTLTASSMATYDLRDDYGVWIPG